MRDTFRILATSAVVGRGYDGWDSIRNAAERYQDYDRVTVLYFGDFDPSGEDMVRSLRERLLFFGCFPALIKCALNMEDVTTYNLPLRFWRYDRDFVLFRFSLALQG